MLGSSTIHAALFSSCSFTGAAITHFALLILRSGDRYRRRRCRRATTHHSSALTSDHPLISLCTLQRSGTLPLVKPHRGEVLALPELFAFGFRIAISDRALSSLAALPSAFRPSVHAMLDALGPPTAGWGALSRRTRKSPNLGGAGSPLRRQRNSAPPLADHHCLVQLRYLDGPHTPESQPDLRVRCGNFIHKTGGNRQWQEISLASMGQAGHRKTST